MCNEQTTQAADNDTFVAKSRGFVAEGGTLPEPPQDYYQMSPLDRKLMMIYGDLDRTEGRLDRLEQRMGDEDAAALKRRIDGLEGRLAWTERTVVRTAHLLAAVANALVDLAEVVLRSERD